MRTAFVNLKLGEQRQQARALRGDPPVHRLVVGRHVDAVRGLIGTRLVGVRHEGLQVLFTLGIETRVQVREQLDRFRQGEGDLGIGILVGKGQGRDGRRRFVARLLGLGLLIAGAHRQQG